VFRGVYRVFGGVYIEWRLEVFIEKYLEVFIECLQGL